MLFAREESTDSQRHSELFDGDCSSSCFAGPETILLATHHSGLPQQCVPVKMSVCTHLYGLLYAARIEEILDLLQVNCPQVVEHVFHMVLNHQGCPSELAWSRWNRQTVFMAAPSAIKKTMKDKYVEMPLWELGLIGAINVNDLALPPVNSHACLLLPPYFCHCWHFPLWSCCLTPCAFRFKPCTSPAHFPLGLSASWTTWHVAPGLKDSWRS